jgi:hypothetical protein
MLNKHFVFPISRTETISKCPSQQQQQTTAEQSTLHTTTNNNNNNRQHSNYSASTVLQWPTPPSAVIHQPPNIEHCDSSIVTAYFEVPSKFSSSRYDQWMKNILSLQDCMTIFTYPDKLQDMQDMRNAHGPDRAARTVYITMPLNDLPIAQWHVHVNVDASTNVDMDVNVDASNPSNNPTAFWQGQLDQDREKAHHKSYQLFWIWLSKTWFVTRVIHQHNYFQSNLFLYSDMGCYRNAGQYHQKRIVQHPEVVPRHSVVWMAHHPPNAPPTPYWNDKFAQKQHYFHSGSSGVAYSDTWLEYHKHFAAMLDGFVERGMFVGEDQCVLQGTCQAHPDLCAYIESTQVQDNHYFGVRYILHHGGEYRYWYMPGATTTARMESASAERMIAAAPAPVA